MGETIRVAEQIKEVVEMRDKCMRVGGLPLLMRGVLSIGTSAGK